MAAGILQPAHYHGEVPLSCRYEGLRSQRLAAVVKLFIACLHNQKIGGVEDFGICSSTLLLAKAVSLEKIRWIATLSTAMAVLAILLFVSIVLGYV